MQHIIRHPILSALRCPVCGSAMRQDSTGGAGHLLCTGGRTHCFDMARSGYVHLAPAHSGGGDSREAVRARTEFLSAGYYHVAARALCDLARQYLAPDALIVDAGCGEGYYTEQLAQTGAWSVCGFDLSRDAVDSAAKLARRQGRESGAFYAVGSVFDLPLAKGSVDAVVNIFAPCAQEEFCRVLKTGGLLILLGAGARHLLGLKQVLYEQTYTNTARADLPTGMQLIEQRTVRDTVTVRGREHIDHLFSMTPYYWRTSPADRRKLEMLDELTTEIEFDCRVYRKP